MKKAPYVLGTVVLLALLSGCSADHSFGRVGPIITLPPPSGVSEPLFAPGPEAGTVVVTGTSSTETEDRPFAEVRLLNLDLGEGVIVIVDEDGSYSEIIPGDLGDRVEVEIEFEGETVSEVFTIAF